MAINHTIVLDPETDRFDSRNPFGRFELLPAKITGLAKTASTATSISIVWNADPIADTYNVYVNGTDTPYMTGVTGTQTTLTGLSDSSTFQISVTGENDAGEGPPSDKVTMSTEVLVVGARDRQLHPFPEDDPFNMPL
ncbi:MAG: fibronectin type III domain-containing protein, partial [Bosea sp. (in: a-proteobacteria)]